MYNIETKTILTPQNGLNIYRGRTEDAIYTYNADGIDDIGVKPDADDLLYTCLKKRKSRGMIIAGNMGDPYNEHEQGLKLMRKCLKYIEMMDFGVVVITRRALLLRDIDILKNISRKTKAVVEIPFPSLDPDKLRLLDGGELAERLELVEGLKEAKVPFVLNIFPLIPFVNDGVEEMEELLGRLGGFGPAAIELDEKTVPYTKKHISFMLKEFSLRFPEEYKSYKTLLGITEGEPKELKIRNGDKIEELLKIAASRAGAKSDPVQIADWKRTYENRLAGSQMTLF